MLLSVDPGDKAPLYEQIAAQIRGQIARGDLPSGEKLPTARFLAEGLGVNMHTVLRAYSDLRDEGLIELRRRRGAVVRPPARKQARVLELAKQLAVEAKRQNMSEEEIIQLVRGNA